MIVLPVLFEGQVKAVIELASLTEFTASHIAFLEQLTGSIGIVLNTIEATMRTEGLLKQSQELAAELQSQQKELQQTNDELAQKARLLAAQNAEVERKNQEIDQARRAVEEKAAELALTSRYKSEFLANMSHELRTPLNTILILGQQLAENADGNLSGRQVEFAKTIHGAGTDLLNLISDILDLSKIESGHGHGGMRGAAVRQPARARAAQLRPRGGGAQAHVQQRVRSRRSGRAITTDPKRLLQVLKNLLSNAFKFTDQGGVRLDVAPAAERLVVPIIRCLSQGAVGGALLGHRQRHRHSAGEAEASSSKRSSRPTPAPRASTAAPASAWPSAASLRICSAARSACKACPGSGSTFTLYLPVDVRRTGIRGDRWRRRRARETPARVPADRAAGAARRRSIPDDRERSAARRSRAADRGGRSALRARAARARARPWLQGTGRDARRGSADARAQVQADRRSRSTSSCPTCWAGRCSRSLKQDPATRHIPVQIITVEEERQHGLERGAFAYLNKPLTTEASKRRSTASSASPSRASAQLLVVEDNPAERMSIEELIGTTTWRSPRSAPGAEALAAMRERNYDCVVLDLRLPDISGFELLAEVQKDPSCATCRSSSSRAAS